MIPCQPQQVSLQFGQFAGDQTATLAGMRPMAATPSGSSAGTTESWTVHDTGFRVTADLVGRVTTSYLEAIQAGDETLDDQANPSALARRIATDSGEDETLVRRVVAEVAHVLSDPDRSVFVWAVVGALLLALRYPRLRPEQRLQVRWPLAATTTGRWSNILTPWPLE